MTWPSDRLPTDADLADEWDAIADRELTMARSAARAVSRAGRMLEDFADLEDPTGYLEVEFRIARERAELAQWVRGVRSARSVASQLRERA